jgi:hypothetical protein
MAALTRYFAGRAVLLMTAIAAPIAASAQASSGDSGIYVADVREAPAELGLSSSIELRPDGHFDWRFHMRQLTLSAHGDWERDGDMIRLGNPQQVGEPGIELASSTLDAADTLRVSLDSATARMASVLEVELEYPDNAFARVPLAGGEISIPAGEQRPIAVRLTSPSISFRTQPIAVERDGDNALTLRLVPADLGQAFFGSQTTHFDGRGMTLDWRGIALRYDRAPARPAGN